MDTAVLAQHLCMEEQKLYCRIRPHECMNWVEQQSGNAVKNLMAFNAMHEKLGAWVQLSILNTEGLGKRAETIDFWIKVAEVSAVSSRPHHSKSY